MRRILVILGIASAGCNDPTYLQETRPLDTQAAMGAMAGAALTDTALYVLPVRRPSQTEQRGIASETMKLGLAMPVPWAGTRDFDVEIEWSLKNLEGMDVTTTLTLLGGNEFGD